MDQKLRLTHVILLAFSTGALGACGPEAAQVASSPTAVRTTVAAPEQRATSVTLTGEIKPQVESDLAFRTAGRLASRAVDVGDHVSAGQELARLEAVQQEADVQSAEAGVRSAQASLKLASADFDRQKKLIASGFTTRSSYDDAEEKLTSATSALESAKAALETAQDSLDQTVLRAEVAGIITARTAEVGQVVSAAQQIFSLARDGGRDAVFNVYEGLLSKKRDNTAIEIELLADRSVKTTGRVREVSPVVDPETDTVRVKIGLNDVPAEMKLGAAVAGIGHFRPRQLFVLPWSAFFTEKNKPAVWIVDPKTNTVSLKTVVLASYRTGEILIADGLSPGDMVVTDGAQFLWPGKVVQPLDLRQSEKTGGSK